MAEIPPNQGSKTLKIVLFVVLGLIGLCLLCGVGGWFLGGRHIWSLTMPFAGLQATANSKYTQGATITVLPGTADTFILALGVTGGVPPEERAAAQDWVWTEYAKAFADGGFPVQRVAVGVWRGGNNVAFAPEDEVAVEDVIARTGVAAPPVNALIAKEMSKGGGTGGVKVTVGGRDIGGNGGENGGTEPEKSGGDTPDEQK